MKLVTLDRRISIHHATPPGFRPRDTAFSPQKPVIKNKFARLRASFHPWPAAKLLSSTID